MNVSKERSAEFLKATPGTGLHLTHVAVALAPSDLVRVHETGINLVILPRATAPQLAESARGFGERLQETLALDLSEFDVESGQLTQALREVFASAIHVTPELHSGSDVMPLAADVAELTENFARGARQARFVEIRWSDLRKAGREVRGPRGSGRPGRPPAMVSAGDTGARASRSVPGVCFGNRAGDERA